MSLPIVTTITACRDWLAPHRQPGRMIGLVPTMGALHAGHAALIKQARWECDTVVVWIFVNPTQFGPTEDFGRYPRTLDADAALALSAGADLIFAPTVETVYPPGHATHVEVAGVTAGLCGASRPGHFSGVATVVLKMFNMVQPHVAYFGQKDGQQVRVIQRMVKDLNVPVALCIVPTVREADGLALSSRNRYLNAEQRAVAPGIYRALQAARVRIDAGERDGTRLQQSLHDDLAALPGGVVDYAAVVDADRLEPLERLAGDVLLACAVKFVATRLIDNLPVTVPAEDDA